LLERDITSPHGPPEERSTDQVEGDAQPEFPAALFERPLRDEGQEKGDGNPQVLRGESRPLPPGHRLGRWSRLGRQNRNDASLGDVNRSPSQERFHPLQYGRLAFGRAFGWICSHAWPPDRGLE
jgi:hypothetical protein